MLKSEVPMLVVYEGELAGQRWPIEGDRFIVGRGTDCDLTLPERQVSRQHIRIEQTGDGVYTLYDLGSKNGTHVNGQEVRDQPLVLHDGDEIQIALCVKMGFVGGDVTLPLSADLPGRDVDFLGRLRDDVKTDQHDRHHDEHGQRARDSADKWRRQQCCIAAHGRACNQREATHDYDQND